MSKLSAMTTGGLLLLASTHASAVVINGRDWGQLADFTGFSWDQLATVCPADGGLCAGSIGTTSFDGWNWASIDDVGSLFHSLVPAFPEGNTFLAVPQGTAIDTLFGPGGLFSPTDATAGVMEIRGWSATAWNNIAYTPYIVNFHPDVYGADFLSNIDFAERDTADARVGVWLYREPISVPEPTSLTLLALGLALGFAGRTLYSGGARRRIGKSV